MKIAFRVDASLQMGTGHVMRCLTLASGLKEQGAEVLFISRPHQGHLIERIEQQGFQCEILSEVRKEFVPADSALPHAIWLGVEQEQDAEECLPILQAFQPDWLIVDHYAIDYQWHRMIRPYVDKIMVIDDLANRRYDCDVLLDQAPRRLRKDYASRVPQGCKLLLGTNYVLLRSEFGECRDQAKEKRQNFTGIHNVFVSMGGMDPDNVTETALEGLRMVSKWIANPPSVEVVMNGQSPHVQSLMKFVKEHPMNVSVRTNAKNIADLMLNADLAIGAAGATAFERCSLGLPTITIVTAENQWFQAVGLEKAGVIALAGDKKDISPVRVAELIDRLVADNVSRERMINRCFDFLDTLGVQRVVSFLNKF